MIAGALDFLVVLAALYLLECVQRINPDELVIDKRIGKGYAVKKPILYPNDRWGWTILNPFRPFPSIPLTAFSLQVNEVWSSSN